MEKVDKLFDDLVMPKERSEFLQVAGISPALEDFVLSLVDDPEIYNSLPQEQRAAIEAEIDSALSKICLRYDSKG